MKSDFPWGMWELIWGRFAGHQACKANCKAFSFFLVCGTKPSGRTANHILLMSFVNVTVRGAVSIVQYIARINNVRTTPNL